MNEHDGEEWRPVVGSEGRYEVSNFGRVRCLPNRGNHFSRKILKTVVHRDGYIVLSIVGNDGKVYCKKMHRLVAEAFIPREIGKNIVHHKDSVKANNYFLNLEWTTISDNTHYASKDGLLSAKRNYSLEKRSQSAQIGREKCSRPVVQVDSGGTVITQYPSLKEASRCSGIRRATIRDICKGRRSQCNDTYWRYANA